MMTKLDTRYFKCMIDANYLDLVAAKDPSALKINASGVHLELAFSVKRELESPGTPSEVKSIVSNYIYSMEVNLTRPEAQQLEMITKLLKGDANPGKHDADALHLFEAGKYGCRFFITKDRRMLKRVNYIKNLLHVSPIDPMDLANRLD